MKKHYRDKVEHGSMKDCLYAPECEKLIKSNSRSTICSACRSGLYYWEHKPLRRRIQRSKHLTKLQARLTTLLKGAKR